MSRDSSLPDRWKRLAERPGLSRRLRLLGAASAAIVLGQFSVLEWLLREAGAEGVDRSELEELLLQSCLFAGYPRTLNAFDALVAALGERPPGRPQTPDPESLLHGVERGRELFDRIYGSAANPVLVRLGRRHPELPDWILRDAYGRVLSRPGLDAVARELAAVSALVASHLPEQLRSHVRGALRLGATPEQLSELFETLELIVDPQDVLAARGACRDLVTFPK